MTEIKRSTPRRPGLAYLAGLLALVLQILVPALPPAAMAKAMDLAAASPEEAASFAATCLGFDSGDAGGPVPAEQHAKCPVCLGLAQAKGFTPAVAALIQTTTYAMPAPPAPMAAPTATLAAAAFASRAPPLA